jgi:hypothetical protein
MNRAKESMELCFIFSEHAPPELVRLIAVQGVTQFTRAMIDKALRVRLPKEVITLLDLDLFLVLNIPAELNMYVRAEMNRGLWNARMETFMKSVHWVGFNTNRGVNLSTPRMRRTGGDISVEIEVDVTEISYVRQWERRYGTVSVDFDLDEICGETGYGAEDLDEGIIDDYLRECVMSAVRNGDVDLDYGDVLDTEHQDYEGYENDSWEFAGLGNATESFYDRVQELIEDDYTTEEEDDD